MKKFYALAFFATLLFSATQLRAQYSNVPVTGYNADVVANGVGAISASTTATVDNNQFTLAASDWNFSGSCAALSFFMPVSGTVPANSSIASGLVYTLQPYTGLNSLRLPAAGTGTTGSGTLTVATPAQMANIYLLYTGGNGPITSGINVTVTFTDASTQVFSNLTALDWFAGTNAAIGNLGRVDRSATPACATTSSGGPYLYDMKLALSPSNYSKLVQSITIDKITTVGTMNVFAVGMMAPCIAPTAQPTALVQGATTNAQIAASFTAAAGAPTGYLVVQYAAGAPATAPANGTTYTAGQPLGAGTVLQASATASFTATGLTGGTGYDYYVYAYNSGATCGGPIYLTTSPLTATFSTSACAGLAGGTYTVGPTGTYPSITAAIAASAGGITGPVVFELQAAYNSSVETFPISVPANVCVSAAKNITIRPETGATGLSITSANTTGTINFNGANYITIDGRPGGTGTTSQLTIANTNAGTSYAMQFTGDASNDIVKYCTITSRNTSATSGTIVFGAGTTTGNDNNKIDNCSVTDDGSASFPVNGIYSAGTSAAIDNSGDMVTNSNISNYFSATLSSGGILLTGTGNSGWTISNNKLYQTGDRLYTSANTHNGIAALSGSGYTITGNTIGYANASGTGTTNMIGNAVALAGFPGSYTTAGSANATRYIAINCAFTSGGAVSNIQGNTVAGFALFTSSGASSTNGIFCGINVTSGNVNVGTTAGNIIGSSTGVSAIYTASTTAGGTPVGIYTTVSSGNTATVQNNTIGGFDATGTTASTAAGFTGIDAAGSGNISINSNTVGNTVPNNLNIGYLLVGGNLSNISSTPTSASGSSAIVGIRSSNSGSSLSITGNTIRGIQTSGTATTFTGITSTGGVSISVNINNNQIGDATTGLINYVFATSGTLLGINCTGATSAITHNIQNNNITGISQTVAGSNTETYITLTGATAAGDVATVSGNTLTNLSVSTTGTSTFLNHNYIIAGTGQLIINNNSIVTGFTNASAGPITITTTNSTSGNGSINNYTNNNFSNITVTGASTMLGFNNTDGGTGSTKTVTGNVFSNWSGTTNSITCINISYWNGISSLSNNTISNITGQSSVTGISIGSSANNATSIAVANNTVTGLFSIGSGGNVTGLTCSNTSALININGNSINNLSSSGASSTVLGLAVTGSTNTSVFSNVINSLSGSGATSPVCTGLQVSGGTLVNVYKNKVYDISESSAISTTNGAVNGALLSGGTAVNFYNNLIGDLRAPAASLTDAIRGISVTSGSGGTSYNVYYNNLYMNATSTGTDFGTTGIYHTTSATATTAKLDLRNNIVVNISSAAGAGVTTILRRSSAGVLNNFATTSDRNLYYAGTPSATALILYDGTNSYSAFGPTATVGTYQNIVAGRDASSFTDGSFAYASPGSFFQSLTGSAPGFLHLVNGITTLAESGGLPITSPAITDDYDGDVRNTATPDVGADEFNGVTPAPTITLNSITPGTTAQCSATARVISINANTPAGIITGVTITYNNGTAVGPVAMTNTVGNTWVYTIPAASPTNANVTWSVTATNSSALTATYIGASYADDPLNGATASVTATPNPICLGSSANLTMAVVKPATVTVGTGTGLTSSTGELTAFCNRRASYRMQLLFTASELNSLGLAAGSITSVAFNISSLGDASSNAAFTVKMGTTGLSALTDYVSSAGFTTVFPAATYTHAVGLNTITFSTPYNWDGISNLILEVSHNGIDNINNAQTYYTTTAANTVAYGYNGAATGSTSNTRPNVVFVGNGAPTVTSYSWSNGVSTIGTTNPLSVSPSITTVYTGTAIASGCPISASGTVTVNPLPAAPTATNSIQCGIAVPTASVADPNAYTTPTFKWYSAATGGTLLQTSTSTTYTTAVSSTTNFYVSVTNPTTGCESPRTQVTVSVNTPNAIVANVSAPSISCLGTSVNLSVTQALNNNTYAFTWTGTAGSGLTSAPGSLASPIAVTPTAAGLYTYTVTGVESGSGCTAVSTVNLTVNDPLSGIVATATATPSAVCSGSPSSVNANLQGTLYGQDFETFPLSSMVTASVSGTPTATQNTTYFSQGTSSVLFNTTSTSADVSLSSTSNTDLSTSTSAVLTFSHIAVMEGYLNSYDYGYVQYSSDGGANWTSFPSSSYAGSGTLFNSVVSFSTRSYTDWTSAFTGSSALPTNSLWKNETINIPAAALTSQFRLRFRYTTDGSTNYYGWLIDDVKIKGNIPATSYSWSNGSTVVGTTNPLPVSPLATTSYTCTAILSGCSITTNAATVTVNPVPTAPSGTNSTQCSTGIPTASVASTAGAVGSGTFYWYDAPSGGNLLQGAALGTTPVNYYVNDFSTSTLTNSSISGSASIAGGTLTLQAPAAGLQGGLTVNASGVNSTVFQTDFDVAVTATSAIPMADGFSYSFADDASATATSPSAEHGTGSKLKIGFFTYNAVNGSDGMGIYLMYNCTATTGYTSSTPGVLMYSTDVSWIPTAAGTVNSHVNMTINASGKLNLTLNGTPIFTSVQLPPAFLSANKSTWKHVISSRSGGVAGGFAIDNVQIQANSTVPGYTTYQTAITGTTTFYVSELGTAGCESPRTPVTATFNSNTLTASANPTTVSCLGNSTALSVSQTGSTNNYTLTWTASPSAGSGIPTSVGGSLASATTVSPTAAGTYTYTITGVDGACNAVSTVNVTVNDPNAGITATATATPNAICAGNPSTLSVSLPPATSIGTSSNLTGSTDDVTAFGNRWPSFRMQMLFTASELNAAGIFAGPIQSMTFNIASIGDGTDNPNYTVLMGSTTSTALTGYESTTGYTTVFPAATYTHAIGLNTITFSTPYSWNGTSNVVVDITYLGADALYNAQTYYTATAVNTVAAAHSGNSPGLSVNRPNVIFGGATLSPTAYSWSNGSTTVGTTNPLTVIPATTTNYTATLTVNGCPLVSNVAPVTVTPIPSLAAGGASGANTQGPGSTYFYTDPSCNLIGSITTAASNLGAVTADVAVDGTVQSFNGQPYLQRHFVITPTTQGPATVKLYVLQSEFDAYNLAAGAYPQMPTFGSNSAPNIANVKVTKFTGATPGSGNSYFMTPTSVFWNATNNWWEITVSVPSFSGFFIHTGIVALNIKLVSIDGQNFGHRNKINWVSSSEDKGAFYVVQRSIDGVNFVDIGTVATVGKASSYSLWDENPATGLNHYRLKMIDLNKAESFSRTVDLVVKDADNFVVEAFPNPVTDVVNVKVYGSMGEEAQVRISDVSGKMVKIISMSGNQMTVDMSSFASGLYFVKYSDKDHSQTIKVNKQ